MDEYLSIARTGMARCASVITDNNEMHGNSYVPLSSSSSSSSSSRSLTSFYFFFFLLL